MPWTYTPGGVLLGDRITAMKPYMYEVGLQKLWNELNNIMLRPVGAGITITGRTQLAQVDPSNTVSTTDFTTPIPKNFIDPMYGRAMPGYGPAGSAAPFGTTPTQQIIFDGFNG